MRIEAGTLRVRRVPLAEAGPALELRARVFRGGACDRDGFDARASHLIVERAGTALGAARLSVQGPGEVLRGYTAGFYGLEAFARAFPRALEVGRVCLAPGCADPDVPRLLLGAMAQVVERERVGVLHGCTSFPIDAAPLSRLAGREAPAAWAPVRRAAETRPLTGTAGTMPPLMRAWLGMGAVVSDHAVVDRDLGTVHVFTALPIAAIPPARARLLTGMLSGMLTGAD
ncbi:GNAT family N-acetyltransferase [Jannaschia formosa]|uniref:GNAT family N-acetyltransferase n=1 Tax=Jannaschia formosa TaxID=2259592 RepID=UPI000E1BAF64|nr:GNAT family N-acetyltransferase [Jannaschia formosa]TFL19661.1 GNAT family N-acetyltransferase [Jannaschia formosa]